MDPLRGVALGNSVGELVLSECNIIIDRTLEDRINPITRIRLDISHQKINPRSSLIVLGEVSHGISNRCIHRIGREKGVWQGRERFVDTRTNAIFRGSAVVRTGRAVERVIGNRHELVVSKPEGGTASFNIPADTNWARVTVGIEAGILSRTRYEVRADLDVSRVR
jgi:hypothetical protein